MNDVLKEADYKIATIEWLLQKGLLDDNAVLINELPVDNFNRRADLVVANGKLHAFEIKSDADSLSRLNGQINTYLSFFDKVTVVCSSKYTQKALLTLPSSVEILELTLSKQNKRSMKIIRRGKINRIKSPYNYLSFVEKKNLINFLRKNGFACNPSESRFSLCEKFKGLSQNTWRKFALDYLKQKYKTTHEAFFSVKNGDFENSDLNLLSPQYSTIKYQKIGNSVEQVVYEKTLERTKKMIDRFGIDISEKIQNIGIFTSEPVHIIPRLKK